MIVFDLTCKSGHTFEGWFEDGSAYEQQRRKKMIACPVCDNTDVSKIPSTFGIKSSSIGKDYSSQQTELEQIGKKLAEFVEKNFDNVGCDFAKEALKMHYGVIEPRNIRGVSSEQEEKIMKEEGVKFIKVPAFSPSESDS
ncbi:MAG: DUF1178 family protein [Pseudomonadota bacterium]|jgi:hypothetical protein